jgi:hypothetical protein
MHLQTLSKPAALSHYNPVTKPVYAKNLQTRAGPGKPYQSQRNELRAPAASQAAIPEGQDESSHGSAKRNPWLAAS